jgi:hypothetical protein
MAAMPDLRGEARSRRLARVKRNRQDKLDKGRVVVVVEEGGEEVESIVRKEINGDGGEFGRWRFGVTQA